jgi:hypothetical protein
MGTQRVDMKGAIPWLVRWACRAGTRDFCLVHLVGTVQNIFFLTVHYYNSFVPITQPAGQAKSYRQKHWQKVLNQKNI